MSKTDMPATIAAWVSLETEIYDLSPPVGLWRLPEPAFHTATPYVRADLVKEAVEALESANEFISQEIRSFMECSCVLSKADMEPIRESLDQEDLETVEAMEDVAATITAALSKLKEAGL